MGVVEIDEHGVEMGKDRGMNWIEGFVAGHCVFTSMRVWYGR